MTPAIVQALEKLSAAIDVAEDDLFETSVSEPSLSGAGVGQPISHVQVLQLSQTLKSRNHTPHHLDILLRGSRVFVPLPPVKSAPTPEYKALMTRLRAEEEARSYERMINPLPPTETFSERFPSSGANAFASSTPAPDLEEDDISYSDINRQVALIFNVVVSIVATAAFLWTAARYWSTPMRLALSMIGSLLVAVAEVVVYAGYIRRLGLAKSQEKGIKEVRKIVKTWVVGGDDDKKSEKEESMVEKESAASGLYDGTDATASTMRLRR